MEKSFQYRIKPFRSGRSPLVPDKILDLTHWHNFGLLFYCTTARLWCQLKVIQSMAAVNGIISEDGESFSNGIRRPKPYPHSHSQIQSIKFHKNGYALPSTYEDVNDIEYHRNRREHKDRRPWMVKESRNVNIHVSVLWRYESSNTVGTQFRNQFLSSRPTCEVLPRRRKWRTVECASCRRTHRSDDEQRAIVVIFINIMTKYQVK